MKQFLSVVFLSLIFLASSVEAAEKYKRDAEGYMLWATVGSNPCKQEQKSTCTLEAAFARSNFPLNAQKALKAEIDAGRKTRVAVKSGEKFDFIQFENNGFLDKVKTAWSASKKVFADLYSITVEGNIYEAFRFVDCGNWAMRSKIAPIKITKYAKPKTFVRGDIPVTNCGGAGCTSCKTEGG